MDTYSLKRVRTSIGGVISVTPPPAAPESPAFKRRNTMNMQADGTVALCQSMDSVNTVTGEEEVRGNS